MSDPIQEIDLADHVLTFVREQINAYENLDRGDEIDLISISYEADIALKRTGDPINGPYSLRDRHRKIWGIPVVTNYEQPSDEIRIYRQLQAEGDA